MRARDGSPRSHPTQAHSRFTPGTRARRTHLHFAFLAVTIATATCLFVLVAGAASSNDVVIDTFTDHAGVDLVAHTGEQGAEWGPHPDYGPGIKITPEGAVYNGTNTKVYLASGTPPSAEYDVEADLIILTNQDHGGVIGRADVDSDTYYAAEGSSARGIWQLRKRVDGEWTLLDYSKVDLEEGRTYELRLELRRGSQKFYVDNVLVAEAADDDPALQEAGRAGIRLSSDDYHADDPSKGWHLDNFRVTASTFDDRVPPPIPPNFRAYRGCDASSIDLDWADVADPDLAGYIVYRSSRPDGPFIRLNANLVSTSAYEDFTAPAGAPVFYHVTAVDRSGNESGRSNQARLAAAWMLPFLAVPVNR